jgi:hypothetical protein
MINAIQQTKKPGWFSEPKNVATTIVALSLFAGLGLWLYSICIAVADNCNMELINLIIGGAVLVSYS